MYHRSVGSKYSLKYGRIICFLNEEEGLYPHSYDIGKHNGKDLLQCVEINPNNLKRLLDDQGHPFIFIANPSRCEIKNVIDVDEDGKTNMNLKLDI